MTRDDPSASLLKPLLRVGLAVGAVVLLALLAAVARPKRGVEVLVAETTRKDLLVPILCDGSLEPGRGGELRATAAATVREVLVREGERVAKGTPLVRLDAPALTTRALEARAEALRLGAEAARLHAELRPAREGAAMRRGTAEGDRRLAAGRAMTKADADASSLAAREAEEKVATLESALRSIEGTGGGASRLGLAEASAHELERQAAALTVTAPTAGIVYGLPRQAGEPVAPGQLVASVSDPAHRVLRAHVDQPELPRVAAGQRLVVTFDGLPERKWEGKVTLVAPGLRPYAGRDVGEVLGEIDDPSGALPPNASVNVQIVAGEKSGALSVPRGALFREGAARFVYRFENGKAVKRPITVGLVGLSDVEVLTGLSERDLVLLPGATPLSDGLSVRAAGK